MKKQESDEINSPYATCYKMNKGTHKGQVRLFDACSSLETKLNAFNIKDKYFIC